MEYEIGTRLDLILSNQKALEAQIKELSEKVDALLLRAGQSGQFKKKKPEEKEEVPEPEIIDSEELEAAGNRKESDLGLSKHAPKGGKWKVAE